MHPPLKWQCHAMPTIFATRTTTSTNNSFGPPVMASNFPCNTATHGPGGTWMELLELFARLLATSCMPQIFLSVSRVPEILANDQTMDFCRKTAPKKSLHSLKTSKNLTPGGQIGTLNFPGRPGGHPGCHRCHRAAATGVPAPLRA